MKEKFLHEIWKNKAFQSIDFRDTNGNEIEILDFGTLNNDAGPDFHSAKIKTQGLTFFGNIEIHQKSSDWYLHRHQNQKEYESIILHLVYEHDREIAELSTKNIPTIELKHYISENFLESQSASFIPCEDFFEAQKFSKNFVKEMIFQKLEEKHWEIKQVLEKTKNDYEAVLFQKMAYTFGLKVNADIFLNIAQNIDFSVIKKLSHKPFQLESLLLGKADLLKESQKDNENYRKEYDFLKAKFRLDAIHFPVKMMRMRPQNFPTIRLSQLAQLYHLHQNLFSKIINAKNIKEIKALFKNVKTSEYWENHYTFDKENKRQEKFLSSDFVEIIIINAIIPVIYSYHREQPNILEKIIGFYQGLKAEKNSIIKQWKNLGAEVNSALETQAFLYYYKNYCQKKKCLDCHQIQTKN